MTRRLLAGATLTTAGLLASAGPAAAHGVGARGDLPLPLWYVLYGAVAVLVFTFFTLGYFWREPRIEGSTGGLVLGTGGRTAGILRALGQLLGALALVTTIAAAIRGTDLPAYALFIGLWVVVPLVLAVVGDLYPWINPFAGLADLVERFDIGRPPAWLQRAGHYPAAVVLLVFGWFELAHPDPAAPSAVLAFVLAYTLAMLLGAIWWGRAWIDQADAFGVYYGLVGRLGVLQRGEDGRWRLRVPLAALADVRPARGTAAVVLVALAVTSFDGLTRSDFWTGLMGTRTGWSTVPLNTLGILLTTAIVAGAYYLALGASRKMVERPTAELAEMFAHSLVPIALGYAVAHYFSLVAFDGQLLLSYASDPLDLGWDLFGTAGGSIDFTVVSTTTIAFVQVAAIVLGHVAGVVLAHDRAVARFDAEVATTSQHALLGAMVLYTVGGLVLLLGA